MADPSIILNIHFYTPSHNNKAANLKFFFAYSFDIQKLDTDLLDQWVIHGDNIYAGTNVEDYELWACIQMNFQKFVTKDFDILDSSIGRRIREYYYLHRFWINVNNSSKTFTTAILEAIAAD